jgi:hypothetical protein
LTGLGLSGRATVVAQAEPVGRGVSGDGRFNRSRWGGSGSNRRVVRRCAAFGEVAEGDGSADFGGFGADPRVEVLAAQPIAVAFEAEDLGVVDEPVDHRGGGHVVAEDFPPR